MGEKSTSKSRRATVPSLPVVAKSAAALPDGSALVSYCLLAALSLQYGAQPLMNARFLASRAVDPRAVVLATEGAKAALCLPSTALQGSRRRALPPGSRTHTRTRKLLSAAAPAVCYLVQNLALQRAYADLDSVTFNCLNQTKIVATAASLYLLTGVGQSPMQMVALVLVTLAGLLLQVTGERARTGTASVDTFRRGVAACVLASALSGLASTLSQMVLQRDGQSSAEFTFNMALVTCPALVASLVWSAGGVTRAMALVSTGWTLGSWVPILSQALGGIVVGLITKRLGGISKGFAVVCGLIVTGALQMVADGKPLSAELVAALVLVACSVWLHMRHPLKPKQV